MVKSKVVASFDEAVADFKDGSSVMVGGFAGRAGIPAFYTPAAVGTELAEGKEHRDFKGRTYLLEHAIIADYAFVRAWKADEFGNLVFRESQRNFNPIMATAGDCTIVEAEEI